VARTLVPRNLHDTALRGQVPRRIANPPVGLIRSESGRITSWPGVSTVVVDSSASAQALGASRPPQQSPLHQLPGDTPEPAGPVDVCCSRPAPGFRATNRGDRTLTTRSKILIQEPRTPCLLFRHRETGEARDRTTSRSRPRSRSSPPDAETALAVSPLWPGALGLPSRMDHRQEVRKGARRLGARPRSADRSRLSSPSATVRVEPWSSAHRAGAAG